MQINLGDGSFVEFLIAAEDKKELKKLLKEHGGEGQLSAARKLRLWKVYSGADQELYVLNSKIYRRIRGPKRGLR